MKKKSSTVKPSLNSQQGVLTVKQWKYGRVVPVGDLKGRAYKGRQSPVWTTDTIKEVRQWLDTKPGRNEAFVIDEQNSELQALKIERPFLALKRVLKKLVKSHYPDYMVTTVGTEIRIMRLDSLV